MGFLRFEKDGTEYRVTLEVAAGIYAKQRSKAFGPHTWQQFYQEGLNNPDRLQDVIGDPANFDALIINAVDEDGKPIRQEFGNLSDRLDGGIDDEGYIDEDGKGEPLGMGIPTPPAEAPIVEPELESPDDIAPDQDLTPPVDPIEATPVDPEIPADDLPGSAAPTRKVQPKVKKNG